MQEHFLWAGGASPYVPPVPGHGQFSDQISVKTYVGTGSFYCEMCPRKLGHAQFQKRDSPPDECNEQNYISKYTNFIQCLLHLA